MVSIRKYIFSKSFLWLVYYAVLMGILLTWQDRTQMPPMSDRLFFLVLTVLPPFVFKKMEFLPLIITLFFTVNYHGTAYSYFPTYVSYFPVIVLTALLFLPRKNRHLKIPTVAWILLGLVFIIDLINANEITDTFYSLLLITLFFFCFSKDRSMMVYSFHYVFAIVSIVLSVEYLTVGRMFTYSFVDGTERESWMDPNYFGCVLGMGIISSSIALVTERCGMLKKSFLICTILMTSTIVVMNASRGALLAVIASIVVYIMLSDASKYNKMLALLAGLALVYYLYNNGYFTLLEARLSQGDETGSGRTVIWYRKLMAFAQDSSFFQLLFGMGKTKGFLLGFGYKRGFHNDYIGMLVSYGLVGFTCFISLLVYPIRKAQLYMKEVIAGIVYFATCCMTLEPIISGFFTFFAFYFYIVFLANVQRKVAS